MEKAMILVSVLLLGWTWTLQGVPVDVDQVEPSAAAADVESPTVHTNNRTNLPAPPFNATEVCKLAPETGPCRMYVEHSFYNSSSMTCEVFVYGGCKGNLNNFQNKTDCMEACHTEEKELPTPKCLDC